MDDREARETVARVEALLEETERFADPAARDTVVELVQALLDLYGEGLGRVVGAIGEHDGNGLADALAGDELVAHLLMLHGLHPVPLERRVSAALDEVRPYLESHGGDVELLGIDEGVARLRLEGSCSGCPSSTATLKLAIEEAIHRTAPDVERIEAEGAAEPAPSQGLLQIEMPADPPPRLSWAMAGVMPELAAGEMALRDVAGEPVLFLRLERRMYAYRPACPACGESLGEGTLDGVELACGHCGHRYDARRAGRSTDGTELHLEPVPLLVGHDDQVKVALGAPAPA